jgi:hypothetical protein
MAAAVCRTRTGTQTAFSSEPTDADPSTPTRPPPAPPSTTRAPVASVAGSELALAVGKGEAWTCVITNTRKRGTLTVVKDLRPATDAGRFDLTIDGLVNAIAVGNAGTTGAVAVPTGTHTVGELAAGAVGLGRLPELDRLRHRHRRGRRHRPARGHRGLR